MKKITVVKMDNNPIIWKHKLLLLGREKWNSFNCEEGTWKGKWGEEHFLSLWSKVTNGMS